MFINLYHTLRPNKRQNFCNVVEKLLFDVKFINFCFRVIGTGTYLRVSCVIRISKGGDDEQKLNLVEVR